MGCVSVSGAPDSRSLQKRLTRYLCELEVANQQHKKLAYSLIFYFTRGNLSAMATLPTKKRLSPNVCWSPGGYFELLSERTRKKCGQRNYVPVRVSKLFGPEKG